VAGPGAVSACPPSLSLAERDRRWALVRRLLDEEELDALVVYGDRCDGAGPPQFCPDTYLTNERPGATVVFPRDGEPIVLLWSLNAAADHLAGERAGHVPWIAADRLQTGRDGRALVSVLRDLGVQRGAIGILGIERYGPFFPDGPMPYGTLRQVVDAFPDAVLRPVWERFAELTIARSDEELDLVRFAAAAGEAMAEAMLEAVRPGVSEAELFAVSAAACFRAGANTHWMIVVSGPDHVQWGPPRWTYRAERPRVIESGDVIVAEFFPTFAMLETQQQLTIVVGEPTDEFARAARLAREAYEIGMALLRPDAVFGEVAAAMQAPIEAAGGWNQTPQIHTLNPFQIAGSAGGGLRQIPGMERYEAVSPVVAVSPEFVLRPGVTFAYQPNCSFGMTRANIGGTVVLTEEGPVELNTLPNQIHQV
jgi:Xaa-Pro aminopeptidase